MPMTMVVTRDVPARFRGFLTSCMLEIAPGVYTAPDMTVAVRERVWAVLSDWFGSLTQGAVVMTWPDTRSPGGQQFLLIGEPPKDLYEVGEIVLVRRDLGDKPTGASLKTE